MNFIRYGYIFFAKKRRGSFNKLQSRYFFAENIAVCKVKKVEFTVNEISRFSINQISFTFLFMCRNSGDIL